MITGGTTRGGGKTVLHRSVLAISFLNKKLSLGPAACAAGYSTKK